MMLSRKQLMIALTLCLLLALAACMPNAAEQKAAPIAAEPTAAPTTAPVAVPADKPEAYTFSGTWTSDDEQTVVPMTLHLYEDGTLVLECHENKDGTWAVEADGTIEMQIGSEPYTASYSETFKKHFVKYNGTIGEETFTVQLAELEDPAKVAEENNRILIDRLTKEFASEAPIEAPSGAIVFYGGSNFVKWTSLEKDLDGYPVVNRSIGGSNDPVRANFFDERVAALAPSVILYMSSSNDWTSGQQKDAINEYKQSMFDEMHKKLPETVFVILSSTPNPLRYFGEYHDGMVYVDAQTRAYCDMHERFEFLDVVPALSLENGTKPNEAIWESDRLHLNKDGYALLTALVRDTLDRIETEYGLSYDTVQTLPDDGEEARAFWTTDWTVFDAWTDESFADKAVKYQLAGSWSMDGDYPMTFDLLLNLYADGSAVVYQHSATRGDNHYYGCWTESDTQKGHRITLSMQCETNSDGYVPHEYTYRIFQGDDGYAFSYDFGIIPGSYMRAATLTGGEAIVYASEDAFAAAVDAE